MRRPIGTNGEIESKESVLSVQLVEDSQDNDDSPLFFLSEYLRFVLQNQNSTVWNPFGDGVGELTDRDEVTNTLQW